ncbi:hypothetical protein C1X21_22465 [Pseudomonas sp. FW305-3-2-15-A-LB2]|nr:hypothetical protein C1X17_21100 [Pseudomonas sp. FW305-3-2-15-C-TSA2]PMV24555.1 hypothetical protein C1X22_21500 [Pseudomonas sp. DP16D-L5]PMV36665.1 hypothetical protein C1X21_22465 [Pseudomonas sp. FW305-3-2-15-A-LB2]PMV42657.1 hypothetical protein C1X16_22840 [Pseudomonas sp. FW305-3-2-15-C-R2A1]PMV49287.1 hypothetical protein C1X18_19035 [Pseudomonas sp. FW305-3-2-15-C-LB1]PMV52789.1 hypothetical protein C1X19_22315 [Pseudomonas sp. GW460-4]PMV56951.1 hypothetical protein C1X20_27920 
MSAHQATKSSHREKTTQVADLQRCDKLYQRIEATPNDREIYLHLLAMFCFKRATGLSSLNFKVSRKLVTLICRVDSIARESADI